jgi:hypothetical protein
MKINSRYREDEPYISAPNDTVESVEESIENASDSSNSFSKHVININSSVWKQIFNSNLNLYPNSISSKISTRLIVAVCKMSII